MAALEQAPRFTSIAAPQKAMGKRHQPQTATLSTAKYAPPPTLFFQAMAKRLTPRLSNQKIHTDGLKHNIY